MEESFKDLYDYAIKVSDTYNYINHNNFYATASESYRNYYTQVLMKVAQWFDGRVLGFHDQKAGIFSTRLATALVRGIGNQICGRKILFKSISGATEPSALDKLNKWQRESDFQDAVRKAIKLAVGLGTSLLKLNCDIMGNLWCEALRFDSFHYQTDFRGNVIDLVCRIKTYTPKVDQNKPGSVYDYILVEHRYLSTAYLKAFNKSEDGRWGQKITEESQPYVCYEVHKCTSAAQNDPTLLTSEKIRFDSLPNQVRNALKHDYRILRLDDPQRLPFNNSLGCELLKFDEDMALPGLPFGCSVLQDNIAYLMSYDLAWSYYIRDLYQGAGKVLLPTNFIKNPDRQNSGDVFSGTSQSNFVKVPSLNPDAQKPEQIQFNLRGEEWEAIQNNILKKIATQIGMSPKTIASYLENGTVQKTATEVDAEDDATIAYIEIKRGMFERPINRLIETVLNYMGIASNFSIVFGTPTLVNKDKIIDREIRKLEAGLTTVEDAVRVIYDDEDEVQLKERISRIQEEQARQQQAQPQPYDAFGV